MRKYLASGTVVVAAMVATTMGAAPATAAPSAEGYAKSVAAKVSEKNVMSHLSRLQTIADTFGGNRAVGTPGYAASSAYVEGQLRLRGFEPKRQDFTVKAFESKSHSLKVGGTSITSTPLEYSAPTKSLTAPVVNAPADGSPGCEASDYAGQPISGAVAVIDRGSCSFADKVKVAKGAGAKAAVLVNTENEKLSATLGSDGANLLPAVGIAKDAAAPLRAPGAKATIAVDATVKTARTWNVIAETRTGAADSVVMSGAHLDGVEQGPGVNDNGSGVAGVLETALQMGASPKVKNKVRFAFWGAEEVGLVGATEYVKRLSADEKRKIKQYLNFDMIGSHNAGYFVYDGDGSSQFPGTEPGPEGSADIEATLLNYLSGKGIGPEASPMDGRSDYAPFAEAGIATGGVDSGADRKKTPEQQAKWGGTAGEIYDQNYHTKKDTFANVDRKAISILAPSVGYATAYFAQK